MFSNNGFKQWQWGRFVSCTSKCTVSIQEHARHMLSRNLHFFDINVNTPKDVYTGYVNFTVYIKRNTNNLIGWHFGWIVKKQNSIFI